MRGWEAKRAIRRQAESPGDRGKTSSRVRKAVGTRSLRTSKSGVWCEYVGQTLGKAAITEIDEGEKWAKGDGEIGKEVRLSGAADLVKVGVDV
jgi:hypothetical protein